MRKPLYLIAIAAALTAAPALAQNVEPGADQERDPPSQMETDRTGAGAVQDQDRRDTTGSRTDPTGEWNDPAAVEPAAGQDMQRDPARTDQTRKDRKAMGPVSTEDFVAKATKSGRFEVESSELAAEKTENAEVSAFARQMINDHNKANERLKELAQSADQTAASETDQDAKYKEKIDKLNEAGGRDFDRQYMEMQVEAHKKAVELFRNYAQNGDDVGLKGFAKDTLPTLERHLDQAQRLHKGMR